jgi:hypothetical protein
MRVRFELLVIGSVLGLASGPGVAATLPPVVASQPAVLRVADTDFSTTKDRYIEKTQSTLDEWRRKLGAAADDAGTHARATGNAADADLNAAWQKTQATAKQLAAASASQWDGIRQRLADFNPPARGRRSAAGLAPPRPAGRMRRRVPPLRGRRR